MATPIRVLHLVTDSIRYDNLSVLADHANRESFELTVASVRPPGALQADATARGVASFSLGAVGRSAYPRAVATLARHLRRHRIDVVQTHLFDAQLVGLLAGRLARTPLLVMTAHHSAELPLLEQRLATVAERLSARALAHRIIAPTTSTAAVFTEAYGVDPGRIAVVPHGFDVAAWAPSAEARAAVRAELGLTDRLVIGCLGRLHWIKDHHTLLEGLAPVLRADPARTLLIVGGGDQSAFRQLAARLGVDGQVVFAGHRFDPDATVDAMDLFVHTSVVESFGLVIAEAMAKGKPVVATRVGAAPELLENEPGGRVVATRDAAALRQAVEDLLGRQDDWPAMGAGNRRRVESLTGVTMARRYEELYRAGLSGRRSSS